MFLSIYRFERSENLMSSKIHSAQGGKVSKDLIGLSLRTKLLFVQKKFKSLALLKVVDNLEIHPVSRLGQVSYLTL